MNFGMKFEVRVESNIKINESDIDSWSSKWQDIPIFFVKTIYNNDCFKLGKGNIWYQISHESIILKSNVK